MFVVGGLCFALSAALTAGAVGFWMLVLAFAIGNPSTTAFVSVAQAGLMDAEPQARERNMARWTLAGSVGVVAGPGLVALAAFSGAGWRLPFVGFAVAALVLTGVAWPAHVRSSSAAGLRLRDGFRGALAALRRREVVRWLALLEASNLMLDVLHAFLALYLVDVAGLRPAQAALALMAWTGAGLVGDALLIPLLVRVPGRRYLRASALAVAVVYPAFLLAPTLPVAIVLMCVLGLLNSGWYAIPKAGLYAELPGRSGVAIAVGCVGGLIGACVPLALGLVAQAVGLGTAMWVPLLAPAALLFLVPTAARRAS